MLNKVEIFTDNAYLCYIAIIVAPSFISIRVSSIVLLHTAFTHCIMHFIVLL